MESYSRTIESLAFTVLSRIDDVLYADSLTQSPKSESNERSSEDDYDRPNLGDTPASMTLFDFMGWNVELGDNDMKKANFGGNMEALSRMDSEKFAVKPIATQKKFSYLEKLENLSGLRSPTARH